MELRNVQDRHIRHALLPATENPGLDRKSKLKLLPLTAIAHPLQSPPLQLARKPQIFADIYESESGGSGIYTRNKVDKFPSLDFPFGNIAEGLGGRRGEDQRSCGE